MEDIGYYKEQLASLKEMFTMTTNHLNKVQAELKATNEEMSQSVDYAEKIQSQMLPQFNKECLAFGSLSYYLKQRDKIGGDFIFFKKIEENIVFGIMDCTGHGVPGALLSMMGYNFLNSIVTKETGCCPQVILQELDIKFQEYFKMQNQSLMMKDGMDGVLCSYNEKTKELKYSMAGRPFWYKKEDKWTKHRPDRNSIGGDLSKEFNLHHVQLDQGDEIFIFSDGLPDQFGGKKNKKFLSKRVMSQLKKTADQDSNEKVKKMKATIKKWQGDNEQTDDICFISIKF